MCSPEGVVLSNRFAKETAASYSGAHTVGPYVVEEAWRCFSQVG